MEPVQSGGDIYVKAFLITIMAFQVLALIGRKGGEASDYIVRAVHFGICAWGGWLLFGLYST